MLLFQRNAPTVIALTLSAAACTVAPADATSGATNDDDSARIGQASEALTSGLVSSRKPDGMILSTGNLYFTSHDAATATVWRTAQSSSPGQEILLYSEAGAVFGDLVYANVGGSWWGYLFCQNAGLVAIKRVPLTGGAATTLAVVKNVDVLNSHRNLITDGVSLFWQDDVSVRKMPIGGGTVTVLDTTTPNTPTAGLALQNGNVIYASSNAIRYVPVGGALTVPLLRTIVNAASRVTALYAVSNGVYWGENSGAVRVRVGSATTTLPSTPGLVPTSISTNGYTAGAAQAWTQCAGSSCRLQYAFPAWNASVPIAAGALGVTVTSTGYVYYGDDGGVHRQVF